MCIIMTFPDYVEWTSTHSEGPPYSPIAALTSTGSDSGEKWLSPAAFMALTLNTYFSPVTRPWQMNLQDGRRQIKRIYGEKFTSSLSCSYNEVHVTSFPSQACCCTAPRHCCRRHWPRCSTPPALWRPGTPPKTQRPTCPCF